VARAQVQQEPFLETTEGSGININCSHPNIKISDYIYWYRQLPGREPKFLAIIVKGSKDLPEREARLRVSEDR
ncbi:TVA4 protein, partial [Cisticola juncidis]|nr:TVA4 protein [Cisticola juncidis]